MQVNAKLNRYITQDQVHTERLALDIFNSPEVMNERAETVKRLEADAGALTASGRVSMQNGADEMAFWACLTAANGDPADPKMILGICPPHNWTGTATTPGSRIGIENPDNIYHTVTLSSRYRYEITARCNPPEPQQFSFFLFSSYMGEDNKQNVLVDTPLGGLLDREIVRQADGSFTLTLDGDPAGGRPNHLQLPVDTRELLIRETLMDWGVQRPLTLQIKRVDSVAAESMTQAQRIHQAVRVLSGGSRRLLALKKDGYGLTHGEPNVLAKPVGRGGDWGFFSFGSYKLMEDEALMVTVDLSGARYLGYVVTDPWMVSREPIRANGSLNNRQVKANKDGTITFFVSCRDPGVNNWLDTAGLLDGGMMIRWQLLPDEIRSIDGAIREQKIVKLSEIPAIAAARGLTAVSPEDRVQLYQQRVRDYEHRYLPC